jgi:hypothetical protein
MRLEIRGLDVWGNEDDGYEVNDVYGVQGSITVDDAATEQDIVAALIAEDVIYPGEYEIEDFYGDSFHGNLTDADTGRPILELRAAEGPERDTSNDPLTPFFVR